MIGSLDTFVLATLLSTPVKFPVVPELRGWPEFSVMPLVSSSMSVSCPSTQVLWVRRGVLVDFVPMVGGLFTSVDKSQPSVLLLDDSRTSAKPGTNLTINGFNVITQAHMMAKLTSIVVQYAAVV